MNMMNEMMLEAMPTHVQTYRFNATSHDELKWDELLGKDAEGYRYHLVFEKSQVEGFQTGYIIIGDTNRPLCIAPYFIVDYRLDTTVQGPLKKITHQIHRLLPGLMTLRVLCVGSAVTDSCRLGLSPYVQHDHTVIKTLHGEIQLLAERTGARVMAFKDVLAGDVTYLDAPLAELGYSKVDNMPIAKLAIDFKSMDDYFAKLSYSTRKDLRRKLRSRAQIQIEEYDGAPPDIQAIYQLYLNCYQHSDLKFEKLTYDFFRLIPELMPGQCRYVLYKHQGKLVGFNLLTYRDGVLLDKYIGLDYEYSHKLNLYFLSWLHNIEMCIRDGFHTYQSGQAAYETKIKLGVQLEQTYIFFQHRNFFLKPLLRLLAKVLAYGNFDKSIRHNEQ